ncbi:hypothetical protein [Paenibacillus xerothermodurans]|uniref:Uncharacterized protein n=1 Tax=Paenibacillus xerothermodurans TaxID=1977292 RepID=A0A2W1NAV4_PAEXE|nr:hypothetical protein [Paenibacillus xerothermodurans]PZE21547.1 hypothetical protein CBW46_003570 [Paenibacillus xerothermodurans]
MFKKLLLTVSTCLCLSSFPAAYAADSVSQIHGQSNAQKHPSFYDFSDGYQGWFVDFADLPVDYLNNDYRLQHKTDVIPLSAKKASHGLFVSGMNRSDDLFMFITKKLDRSQGISPNTKYQVTLEFDIATNAAEGLIGIGGSPGESVFVKAGISNRQPMTTIADSYYHLNLDKGNQATGGKDMQVLGTLEKLNTEDDSYELKHFTQTFEAESNEKGELYVIIGTDSGYEGLTSIYYTNISLKVKKSK